MRSHPWLRLPSFLSSVSLALLPALCFLCSARCQSQLCDACQSQFFGRPRLRCRQCANPLTAQPEDELDGALPDELCAHCLLEPPDFDATLVACDYAAPVDQLVLALKFGGQLALGALFARLLRDCVLRQPDFVLPGVLCPVPLGPARLAERGFNQALEMARPLARTLGVKLYPALLTRVQETPAQSRSTLPERARNLAHAFVVTPGQARLVRGQHIGIVDDVMTSGQTLNHLAATLRRFGAARVTNLVFARTPPP